jgi:hypothetical protein
MATIRYIPIVAGLTISLAAAPFTGITSGQERNQPSIIRSSDCSRESALEIIQNQIDLSKTFDDDVRRIAVLLRAADIIWPHQQDKARATFSDALEVATRNFKEKGDAPRNEGRVLVQVSDQRFKVITAIAKRDAVWANKLSQRILQEDAQEEEDKAKKDPQQDARTGEKLLQSASALLDSDRATAVAFAQRSLAYPATISLPFFLYKLTEIDKGAADQFYQEALLAYARAPLNQFFYLSSYPFAGENEVGEVPVWTTYAVPKGLRPNPSLQRLFVQNLLTRAQALIANPSPSTPGTGSSEAEQISIALARLEPQVATSLSDLSPALQETRRNIYSLLSQEDQQRVNGTLADPPKRSFDEQIENAERLANADRREGALAIAILGAPETEGLEKIEAAAAKLDDAGLRSQLLSRVYFSRAQRAIKEKKIAEARKLAAKVDELDHRAYLYSQIATESIKQTRNDAQARELLEDVTEAVAKAPDTEVKARVLLVVAYLYIGIDPNRSIALLGDAVKCINRLEAVDLSNDLIGKRIEGKGFGFYTTLQMPGSNPETTFREIGKVDFNGTLYLSSNLTDKSLRAMTTIVLAEQCLKTQPARTKPGQSKPAATKP